MVDHEDNSLETVENLRDLGDFCLAWPEVRDLVGRETVEASNLPPASKALIAWLSSLADKVCRNGP